MVIETAVLSPALMSASLEEVKRRNGEPPWSDRVIISDEFTVTAICQPAGLQGDRHYHFKDECWFVAEGEIIWNMATTCESTPRPAISFWRLRTPGT